MKRLQRRLLLQHVATTALILLVGGVALYRFVRWSGERSLDSEMHLDLARMAALIELEPDRVEFHGDRAEIHYGMPVARSWQISQVGSGSILGQSPDLAAGRSVPVPFDAEAPIEATRTAWTFWRGVGPVLIGRLLTRRVREDEPGRSVTMPPTMTFEVRVAAHLGPLEDQWRRLAMYLLAGLPLLLALAALAEDRLLARALRPVELALERERRFAAAASHELRTPLTALRGEVELALRKRRAAEDYRETLQRSQPIIEHMTRVVEGVLTLARAEAGNLLIGSEESSVADLASAIEEQLRMLPGREQVRVFAASSVERFVGDRVLLAQAVRNLVENALSHGAAANATLTLTVERGELEISVDDRGPGFSSDVVQSMARGGPGRVERDGRSRFGLAFTRAVIAAHRGELLLSNHTSGGARVRARIPLEKGTPMA